MQKYCAPLTDMKFLLRTMSDTDTQDLNIVLDQAAHFVEQEWAPVNAVGDTNGCKFNQGQVSLTPELNSAFRRYVDAGWMSVTMPEQWGGQDLPETLGSKVGEMLTSSNHALCMVSALTISACKALIAFGSDELKATYLPNLVSGKWTGTMCLTEAHCGSDLGLIKTTASAINNDTFEISGNKIFISAGDHDASDNIIHLVLARLRDAPAGIKGLSLFLVPKFFPENGLLNTVSCIGLEEKMGIHGNPTCTMSFENATAYLVGRPNEGIKAMFTMMNEMRLGTALQGIGLSEQAFQASYQYAIDRQQGKSLDRNKKTATPADALIVHADIRRMLMTQKSFSEGGRAFVQYCSELLECEKKNHERGGDASKLLGLLTPIAKAFLTETGLESASHAIQVYGGHGFIKETGVEQIYRDGRISTLYEGTTGIQSLDLLGRKVLGDQAQSLLIFTKQIYQLCKEIDEHESDASLKELASTLAPYSKEWPQLAQTLGMKALQNHEEVGAAAYDFLMYSGYITIAYFWLKMAKIAVSQMDSDQQEFDQAFLAAKVKTAQFYFHKILPRAQSHKEIMLSGKSSVSSLNDDEWYF
jgi:alkylation response protein AidB-like acyl-CoA dehydrogenase